VVMLPQGSNVSTTTVQLPPRDHPSHILAFHHSCSCASRRRAEEQEQEQEQERVVGGKLQSAQHSSTGTSQTGAPLVEGLEPTPGRSSTPCKHRRPVPHLCPGELDLAGTGMAVPQEYHYQRQHESFDATRVYFGSTEL
jgi:hypothetical protein